jgi:sterol desaturase/sphingolipid hydroxylase (fatty acid hydroxylase superfamily)
MWQLLRWQEEVLQNQVPTIFLMWLCSIGLAYPERGLINATFGIVFMYFWVYFVHRSLHLLPNWATTHMSFHHAAADAKPLPRWLELVFETATDAGMNLALLVVQWVAGYQLVHPLIVVFFTLTYMSAHIINYSICGSETHRIHHTELNKNFGPDTVDHIVGTNFDESFEDMTPIMFNAACSFVIIGYIKDVVCVGQPV